MSTPREQAREKLAVGAAFLDNHTSQPNVPGSVLLSFTREEIAALLASVPDAPRPAGKDESRLGRLEAALREIAEMKHVGSPMVAGGGYDTSLVMIGSEHYTKVKQLARAALSASADPQETKV